MTTKDGGMLRSRDESINKMRVQEDHYVWSSPAVGRWDGMWNGRPGSPSEKNKESIDPDAGSLVQRNRGSRP